MQSANEMSARARVVRLLSSIDHTGRSMVRESRVRSYLRRGRVPWTRGYAEYRAAMVQQALGDGPLLERLRTAERLPDGYGISLDARVIEIPWVLSRLGTNTGARLLDAGSSLNHAYVLALPLLRSREVTILTLAPERECYWSLGVSYHFGDLRTTVFRDACFDEIVCISTIEHVGLDNTMYAGANAEETDPSGFHLAIREFRRILKPGGRLFLTVPFGRYENHGWFQQFDGRLLTDLIEAFEPARSTETIYRYLASGWQISNREETAVDAFFDVRSDSGDSMLRVDGQAAEGAVACMEMISRA